MTFPRAPQNLQQERAGILEVALELNRLGLIWRETPMTDVGIDGQIELVDSSGYATGRLVAAQVKSGESYFNDGDTEWRFYPAARHRFYWERFPLPVLLLLHSPGDGATYWVDARQVLRSPERASLAYIGVPKQNRLRNADAEDVFSSIGAIAQSPLPLKDVLVSLVTRESPGKSFPVSYFDLFANGLTNGARSVYYGMDLVMEVAETLAGSGDGENWLHLGQPEHDFLFGFVRFLVEQHLADVDISDCLIDWYDREIQPRFIAPLTSRGRAFVELLQERQAVLVHEGRFHIPSGCGITREALLHVQLRPDDYTRILVVREFQRLVSEDARTSA